MTREAPTTKVFSWIYAVAVSTLMITVPMVVLSWASPYYFWSFGRYGIYGSFPDNYTPAYINQQFGTILRFIQFPFNTSLDQRFFSSEDILHMQDVQRLFIGLYILIGICTLLILIKLTSKKSARINSVVVNKIYRFQQGFLVTLIICGVLALFAWQQVFTFFHQVIFPFNSYWLLDPNTSNLIKYFPGQIFQELAAIYLVIQIAIYFGLRRVRLEYGT